MAINTMMSGKEIDRVLRAFLEAEEEKNNSKVLYIRRGELAFENGEALFDVQHLAPVN